VKQCGENRTSRAQKEGGFAPTTRSMSVSDGSRAKQMGKGTLKTSFRGQTYE